MNIIIFNIQYYYEHYYIKYIIMCIIKILYCYWYCNRNLSAQGMYTVHYATMV